MDSEHSKTFWQFMRRKYSDPHYRLVFAVGCVLSALLFAGIRLLLWNFPVWLNVILAAIITLTILVAYYIRFDRYKENPHE